MSPIWRETRSTLALAIPISLGSASQMVLGAIDSAMIGQVGTVPLAASAFTLSIFNMFFVVSIGVLLPGAVLVSRAIGSGRLEECREWVRHGVCIALVSGGLAAAAMALLATQLHRFGQPDEVIAVVKPFYLLMAASMLPGLLFQILRQYAEASGRAWLPMGIMGCGVLLNVGLNFLLIYGLWFFPKLGLTGAGISTLITRLASMLVLAFWLAGDRSARSTWPERWAAPLSAAKFREFFALGLPTGGQLLFEVSAFGTAAIMMGWLGSQPLAAHQIAMACVSLTFMFPLGVSSAASMRISQAIGEGRLEALRPIGFGALGCSATIMGCFALLLGFGGEIIARLFVKDPEVVQLASRLLVVAGFFQLFDGAQVVGAGILRGMSDVRVPTIVTFFAYWMLAIPIAWYGSARMQSPDWVWWGIALGLAFAAVFHALRFGWLTLRRRGP